MTKMMEESFLEDKGLKIAVVKKKKIAVVNMLHVLKTKKEHVKMKSTQFEMKDTPDRINRLDAAVEKVKNLKA